MLTVKKRKENIMNKNYSNIFNTNILHPLLIEVNLVHCDKVANFSENQIKVSYICFMKLSLLKWLFLRLNFAYCKFFIFILTKIIRELRKLTENIPDLILKSNCFSLVQRIRSYVLFPDHITRCICFVKLPNKAKVI